MVTVIRSLWAMLILYIILFRISSHTATFLEKHALSLYDLDCRSVFIQSQQKNRTQSGLTLWTTVLEKSVVGVLPGYINEVLGVCLIQGLLSGSIVTPRQK